MPALACEPLVGRDDHASATRRDDLVADERQRWDDDRVTGADSGEEQPEVDRRRTARHRDRVWQADEFRDRPLELGNQWPPGGDPSALERGEHAASLLGAELGDG